MMAGFTVHALVSKEVRVLKTQVAEHPPRIDRTEHWRSHSCTRYTLAQINQFISSPIIYIYAVFHAKIAEIVLISLSALTCIVLYLLYFLYPVHYSLPGVIFLLTAWYPLYWCLW